MWQHFDGKPYTQAEFAAYVAAMPKLPWIEFFTAHNTAAPTLEQWETIGGATPAERIANLQSFYENEDHWHAGPHLFIDREHIWTFTDLTVPGVHASCFNHISAGMEMVGDFSTEPFDPQVRDNAVFAMALLHKHCGLRPDRYVYGQTGLHLHRDCVADHHPCPGAHVNRADFVARILTAMENKPAPLAMKSTANTASTTWVQMRLKASGADIDVDGEPGEETIAALKNFQAKNGLTADGILGPDTVTALKP
jgi:hypothetical protein